MPRPASMTAASGKSRLHFPDDELAILLRALELADDALFVGVEAATLDDEEFRVRRVRWKIERALRKVRR